MRGFIGGKSNRSTRIERFWRDCNTNVKKHCLAKFKNLEDLGHLDRHSNNNLWILHKFYLPSTNERLDQMKSCHNEHLISSESNKSPNQVRVVGGLHGQVTNTSVPKETLGTLHDC